jgi:hypothetical protein
MKANELRVGNLFTSRVPVEVSWIEKQRTNLGKDIYQCNRHTFSYEHEKGLFCGIPLTKEWIKRLGFERNKDGDYVWYKYIISFSCDKPIWFGQHGCCQQETIREGIQYVHQLQNLYFALTGEELTTI